MRESRRIWLESRLVSVMSNSPPQRQTYVKNGGKLHMGGKMNPFVAVMDFSGVDGFDPSVGALEPAVIGAYDEYVTGLDEAVASGDCICNAYDVVVWYEDDLYG